MNEANDMSATQRLLIVEKPQLALDALLKLTRQFSHHPEFQQLIYTLLFTLSGQLSVSSSFAIFKKPDSTDMRSVFLATGKYITDKQLASLFLNSDLSAYFIDNCRPMSVDSLNCPDSCRTYKNILKDCDVRLVCPVVHGDNLLGFIGLSGKVTGKPYGKGDMELLETLINTVTPLVSNSYQFWEIQKLGAWYFDILNNVKQGVFAFGNDNRLKKINAAGIEILRRHNRAMNNAVALIRSSMEEIFPVDCFGDWWMIFNKAITENDTKSFHNVRAESVDGQKIYDVYLKRISGDSDFETDFIVTLDDVTERKNAERALELTQFSIDNAVDAAIWINCLGRITYANRAASNLLGYARKQLMDMPIMQIDPNITHINWPEIWQHAKESSIVIKESNLCHSDGRIIPVEISANYIEFEGAEYNCIFVRDIAERKAVEDEKRARLHRLQRQKAAITEIGNLGVSVNEDYEDIASAIASVLTQALEVNRAGIWLLSEDKEYVYCTDTYDVSTNRHSQGRVLKLTDYPIYFEALKTDRVIDCQNIAEDSRMTEFDAGAAEDRDLVSVLDASISISGELVGIIRLQHIGGQRIWQGDEVQFASEAASQTAAVFAEIERRRAEKQEQKMKEKLEHAEKMEAIGVLAGGVAHDLNNMLGPLVGYPELLLMKMPPDSPFRSQIEKMGRSAQSAADIIQDLLTLARRGRYEMGALTLNDVIEQYLDSTGYTRKCENNPSITVMTRLDRTLPAIFGSAPHLSKVIMNLVVNAIDAMPDGGELIIQTFEFESEEPFGTLSKIDPGQYVVLAVRDTGMGIQAKDIKRIFEPYYSKKKMGSSGSGLGLAVVYGIINDHKGFYDISSEVNKGTEFRIYFPVTQESLQVETSLKTDISGSERILVVDDIDEQRDIATEILLNLGYSVHAVSSGRAAVEYLSHNHADVVVLDMIMENNFDGLDTYREILKFHPTQKALIISGFSVTERVDTLLNIGAGAFIKKPFTVESLGKAVREEIDKQSERAISGPS